LAKDGKEAKIMQRALIFHLTYFASLPYRVKRRCSNCYTTLKVVMCNKLSKDLINTQLKKLSELCLKCAPRTRIWALIRRCHRKREVAFAA